MTRRTVLLAAALLIAAMGSFVVYKYVQGVENRADAELDPVQVLVATKTIPAGTTGTAAEAAASFSLETLTRESVADGALSSTEPILDQVALGPIFAGEQILSQKWGESGSISSLPLDEDKLAMSVQLSDPARVAGFVTPGSEVAVFVTVDGTVRGDDSDISLTEVLIPKVKVIATGQTTLVTQTTTNNNGARTTEEIPRAILTLEVDATEGKKLVHAQHKGELYFALLGEKAKAAPGDPVYDGADSGQNLFQTR